MVELRLALALLWRDWQGGELRLLFFALVMAVTSVTGISLFTERLRQALVLESANMLAADRVLNGSQPPPREWLREAHVRGLQTAETVSLISMAFSARANMLVSAKAVSDNYPLRGRLLAAAQPFSAGVPVFHGPPPGEAWLESRALPALQLAIGDTVHVGEAVLTVSKVLVMEPDRQLSGMADYAGPRLLMNLADLPATKLIQPGSRARYRYLYAGDATVLENFSAWLREISAGKFYLRDARTESKEVGDALDRAEGFLLQGSLFAVLLAGVAIALTARRYSERHYDYVAILKTLGCTSGQVMTIYVSVQLALALIAITCGWVLGLLVHHLILQLLASLIPVELPPAGWQPFVLGALTACICLLSFVLPPLLALRGIPPLRVLQRNLGRPPPDSVTPYAFGVAGAVLLVFWYSQDWRLTGLLAAAVAGVAVLLYGLSRVLLTRGRDTGMQAGSAWKLATTSLRRRHKQNVLQTLVFAIAIMSLLVLILLRTELIDDWQAGLPEHTPNHFMMNVAPHEVAGIQEFFREHGISEHPFFPMIGARVQTINGQPPPPWRWDTDDGNITERGDREAMNADNGQRETRRRGRMRRVSWAKELPPENQVVAGRWWGSNPQPGRVSVEKEHAARLGIEVGDTVVFEVAGQELAAIVQSLRTVRWENMRPNFFFIFSPGTLDHLGATFLSTFLLEQDQKSLLNTLVQRFPTIVVIEVDALIERLRHIIAQVSSAIELIFVLALICGALVLWACVHASLDERFRENAVLRVLGAGRKLILAGTWFEFAAVGLAAGTIATLGAEACLYYLQERVFEQDFSLHYRAWLVGPLGSVLLITGLGVYATRRTINSSPLSVLHKGG